MPLASVYPQHGFLKSNFFASFVKSTQHCRIFTSRAISSKVCTMLVMVFIMLANDPVTHSSHYDIHSQIRRLIIAHINPLVLKFTNGRIMDMPPFTVCNACYLPTSNVCVCVCTMWETNFAHTLHNILHWFFTQHLFDLVSYYIQSWLL